MSEKISRIILTIEAVLIVLPITWLTLQFSRLAFEYTATSNITNPFILVSLAAILSGWRLFIAFFRGGASNLQKKHIGWWWTLLAGILVLIGSLISNSLPPSPEYSRMDSFRFDFDLFILASPLLIPLIHLALEKFVRKPATEASTIASQESLT